MQEITTEEMIPFEPIRVRGFFTYTLRNAKSGKVVKSGVSKNVIVNSGKNLILSRLAGTTETNVSWMDLGSSGTAPADTQTDLVAKSTPADTRACGIIMTSATAAGMVAAMQWSASWNTDVANYYIKEVGLFNASPQSARTMLARANLSISKDNTQTLQINYTIQAQSA